jgi:hypothetical protein
VFRRVKSCCGQEGPELLCSGGLRAVVIRRVKSCCVLEAVVFRKVKRAFVIRKVKSCWVQKD